MKSFVIAIAAASALSVPLVSFAQSNQPVTRAQVREQLVQLEKAGYSPGRDDPYYPENVQAAERRVAAQQGEVASVQTSGYGGVDAGATQSGAPTNGRPMNAGGFEPLYSGR